MLKMIENELEKMYWKWLTKVENLWKMKECVGNCFKHEHKLKMKECIEKYSMGNRLNDWKMIGREGIDWNVLNYH